MDLFGVAGRPYGSLMTFNRERRADREDDMARAEHGIEERLDAVADDLADPEAARRRARDISAAARVHAERAERLRRNGDPNLED